MFAHAFARLFIIRMDPHHDWCDYDTISQSSELVVSIRRAHFVCLDRCCHAVAKPRQQHVDVLFGWRDIPAPRSDISNTREVTETTPRVKVNLQLLSGVSTE